ncbi:hypothetical protein Pcinc_028247 [Petrolisthes cinctipes]|uniref:Uncharacterized protein n=1 Tax=Petrolisthes cinctipes TaxID=88211 RepID=A0AAE1F2G3_PETCI|nr:hypothetical protein Pcinc_036002 [Petrolisthes cinctipes]KAK3866205.1 hypothetical protein Pcinc_028247 [Petrolisthes cinctipes]
MSSAILALLVVSLAVCCSAWEVQAQETKYECPMIQECIYVDATLIPTSIHVQTTQVPYQTIDFISEYTTITVPRTKVVYHTVTASVEPLLITATTVVPSTIFVVVNQISHITSTISSTVLVKVTQTSYNLLTVPHSETIVKSAKADLTIYKTVEDMITNQVYSTVYFTSTLARALVRTKWITSYLHSTLFSTTTAYEPYYHTVTSTIIHTEQACQY